MDTGRNYREGLVLFIAFSLIDLLIMISSWQICELKKARKLASEITQRGASLYDMLAKEIELRVSSARF